DAELTAVRPHVAPEMDQHETLALETRQQGPERRPLDVASHRLLVRRALAEEEIDATRELEETIVPGRVAAVEEPLVAAREADRERHVLVLMRHPHRVELQVGDTERL